MPDILPIAGAEQGRAELRARVAALPAREFYRECLGLLLPQVRRMLSTRFWRSPTLVDWQLIADLDRIAKDRGLDAQFAKAFMSAQVEVEGDERTGLAGD